MRRPRPEDGFEENFFYDVDCQIRRSIAKAIGDSPSAVNELYLQLLNSAMTFEWEPEYDERGAQGNTIRDEEGVRKLYRDYAAKVKEYLEGQLSASDLIQKNAKEFSESRGYRTVTLEGDVFELTPNQSRFVRYLHERFLAGESPVRLSDATSVTDITSDRLCDIFKNNNDAMDKLIKRGPQPDDIALDI